MRTDDPQPDRYPLAQADRARFHDKLIRYEGLRAPSGSLMGGQGVLKLYNRTGPKG